MAHPEILVDSFVATTSYSDIVNEFCDSLRLGTDKKSRDVSLEQRIALILLPEIETPKQLPARSRPKIVKILKTASWFRATSRYSFYRVLFDRGFDFLKLLVCRGYNPLVWP